MSPEQARGQKVDHRTDLFSLGAVLYRLCTGKNPFVGEHVMAVLAALITDDPTPVRELNPNVPEPLAKLIHQLLAKKAEDRPQTATEVAKRLRAILEQQAAPAVAEPPGPRASAAGVSASLPVVVHPLPVQPPVVVPMSVSAQPESAFADLGADDATEAEPAAAGPKPERQKSGGKGMLIAAGVAVLLAVIAGAVVLSQMGKKGDPGAKAPDVGTTGGEKGKTDSKGPNVPTGPLPATFKSSIGMEFVKVPKGTGWLGGGGGKPGETKVEIAQDFYLGKYEVTQEEWEKVMGENPSYFSRNGGGKIAVAGMGDADLRRFPVENVSWDDCQLFIERLNEREKEAGWMYRLPKEAEWEYACRGGPVDKSDSAFEFYIAKPTNMLVPAQANFEWGKGLKRTCKVGSYEPNTLGLYDMHGNIHEWCEKADTMAEGASSRVARGGDWLAAPGDCRAASGLTYPPSKRGRHLGLRLARVPAAPAGKVSAADPNPDVPGTHTNALGMKFVPVRKGTGWLGGGGGKPGETQVEIAQDFYLGKYEVTQAEWEAVTGLNPSYFSRNGGGKVAVAGISDADLRRFPVEQVTWDDCQLFIKKLIEREKEPGWVYRLPTEAEWEYACRGGPVDKSDSAFDFYLDKPRNSISADQANFVLEPGKGLGRTCKVGSYVPNFLGLYDMHGNVWEWCEDKIPNPNDPNGALERVHRGGSGRNESGHCRAAFRFTLAPSSRNNYVGLRLARVPAAPAGKVSAADPNPDVPGTHTNALGMKFVPVPKGTGWLGGGDGKPGDTKVVIEQDFYLGKYEVTQEQWEAVTGLNPSHFSRTGPGKDAVKDIADADLRRYPVEGVSWDDCQAFVKKLNEREKESGWVYRLPKQAEWEYACRGGAGDKLASAFDIYFAKPTNVLLPEQANFAPAQWKGLQRTCKVGSYEPNILGLYDMHGNIFEWCEEIATGTDGASHRVFRGGDWYNFFYHCRAAYRGAGSPSHRDHHIGLRVARVPAAPAGK